MVGKVLYVAVLKPGMSLDSTFTGCEKVLIFSVLE